VPKMTGLPAWAKKERLYRLSDLERMDDLPIQVTKRTLRNYITQGRKNWHNIPVKLERVIIGKVYYTSREAVIRFLEDVSL
jgi:hypothetical protein